MIACPFDAGVEVLLWIWLCVFNLCKFCCCKHYDVVALWFERVSATRKLAKPQISPNESRTNWFNFENHLLPYSDTLWTYNVRNIQSTTDQCWCCCVCDACIILTLGYDKPSSDWFILLKVIFGIFVYPSSNCFRLFSSSHGLPYVDCFVH